jgi:hypothetical protein
LITATFESHVSVFKFGRFGFNCVPDPRSRAVEVLVTLSFFSYPNVYRTRREAPQERTWRVASQSPFRDCGSPYGVLAAPLAHGLEPFANTLIKSHRPVAPPMPLYRVVHDGSQPSEGSSHADSPMPELCSPAGSTGGVQRPDGQVQTLRSFVCAAIYRPQHPDPGGKGFCPTTGASSRVEIDGIVSPARTGSRRRGAAARRARSTCVREPEKEKTPPKEVTSTILRLSLPQSRVSRGRA